MKLNYINNKAKGIGNDTCIWRDHKKNCARKSVLN